MNDHPDYLTIAVSLIAIGMSFPAFDIDRIFTGACYGAAVILFIIFIKLKIQRGGRQNES